MPMRVAPPVVPGDRVAVIAPATPFDRAIFDAGVRWLEAQGFVVDVDPAVFERTRYTSGTVKQRAGTISRALANPEIKALIAVRGGYGSVHLLPSLDVGALGDQPKRIVGCSDLTTLLNFVWERTGVVTYHGPMVAGDLGRGPDAETASDFLATFAGKPAPEKERDLDVLVSGDADGTLVGGCLSLLAASMGTPYEFSADDCILFLEDVKEHPYRIDRMLMQLLLGGKFDRVRGIVFGTMDQCAAPQGSDYRLEDVLTDLLAPLGIPIYFGFPSGHSTPNLTLPLGARARMQGGRLMIEGPF